MSHLADRDDFRRRLATLTPREREMTLLVIASQFEQAGHRQIRNEREDDQGPRAPA
jgi:FixJ family two-component response regulator